MKTPLLTIPEYRKRFAKLVEENMKLEKRIESLQHSLDSENRLRGQCIDENICLREKLTALEDLMIAKK